jgi:putative ABC transport system permease protein
MRSPTNTTRFRFWLWLIALVGVIVPRRLRADWRLEWEAELRCREAMLAEWDRLDWRGKWDLLRRSLSAFWDALWLQPQRWEDEMIQDLRHGARMLWRNPGFTLVAVLTLGLGIGATTAVFGIVNAVMLRPLPFKDPARLVTVWESNAAKSLSHGAVSGANFTDWKDQIQSFESLAAYFGWNYNLTGDGEPQRLTAALVSAGFFQTLGAEIALGRPLLPEDDRESGENVVVLSHAFWRSRYGASPEVIGKTILLNDRPHRVVGVAAAGFDFPDDKTEIWRPMAMSPRDALNREGKWLKVIGRLKPGVSPERASAEMNTVAGRLAESYPRTNAGWGATLVPLRDDLVGDSRRQLLTLFVAATFVLLIACVNVANLLLARATGRVTENAIRAALGAGRWRLLRQFLAESLLLAALGGAVGLALARWGLAALTALGPEGAPGAAKAAIDGRSLVFTLGLSLFTTLLFGLVPARQASKLDLNGALRGVGHAAGAAGRRALDALVIAEVAAGVMLLIGAGLMIRSFLSLQAVEPGFNPRDILTMRIALPAGKYGENQQSIAFFRQSLERIKALPGVVSVGAVQDLPLGQNSMSFPFTVEGRPATPEASRPTAAYRAVTEGYFGAMGIPLISGRAFTAGDTLQTPAVVIINRTMARRFWPDEDPLGKRIRFGEPDDPTYTIVGVVGDVKHQGLADDEIAAIYQPHAQKRFAWLRWMTLVVRVADGDPLALVAPIRGRIAEVDRAQPVYDVVAMERLLSNSVARPRFSSFLFGLFALLALSLAAVGLYGVMSYAVARRAREIGLRMALGARTNDVFTLVIRRGMKLTSLGLAVGLAGAAAGARVLQTLLFHVSATDPLTFAVVAGVLTVVAMLACYLPARRATRVDPLTALRRE